MEHKPFTWFGMVRYPEPIVTAVFVALLLLAFAAVVRRKLVVTEDAVNPDDGVTARNAAEVFVEMIAGVAEGVIGHGAQAYVPLLATFFAFILVSNLLGLVPGCTPPTSDFNVTFALGVVSFVAYNFYGIREHGAKYVKQFMGPLLVLAPLIFVIEVFGHFFRPVSLAVRLFANMFADHQLIEIFTGLVKPLAVVFYLLGTLVSVVQAFVFTMLTATYIALAVSHDH